MPFITQSKDLDTYYIMLIEKPEKEFVVDEHVSSDDETGMLVVTIPTLKSTSPTPEKLE